VQLYYRKKLLFITNGSIKYQSEKSLLEMAPSFVAMQMILNPN